MIVQPIVRGIVSSIARGLSSGGGSDPLVFHALDTVSGSFVNDVIVGTGSLTEACTSIRYLPDDTSPPVWQSFASTVPGKVYAGAKWWLYGAKASTNDQIRSKDLTNAEWTASNVTVAFTATGMTGSSNDASDLTATSGNGTVIANAITDASDAQATRWFIKRKTGTGTINITLDNGSIWQDVTTEVDSTSGFNECFEVNAALANPQIGIRIVTSGDAVYVGNAEAHLGGLEAAVRGSSPVFTAGSTVTINATDDSFDDAEHTVAQGGYYVEWTPQFATSEASGDIEILSLNNSAGLLYYDATNSELEATDGTNIAVVSLTIVSGTTYKVWVAYGGTSLQVGFNSTTGTAGTFDGAFATGTKIEIITPTGNTSLVRNMRHYSGVFASTVATLQALAA